jgi:hypothetical protein
MMRTITATLAAATAVAVTGCGGSGGDAGSAGVSAASAKASLERAADLELAAQPVPKEARDQGLRASFSNAATAAKDRQVLFLFLMKDEKVADEVKDTVKSTVPEPSRLIVNGEVLVVYAANGSDHAKQVEKAVEAL